MTKENQELWKTILGEIETEVSKAIFLTLFKHTFLISFDNDVMTIAAPSAMIIDLLKKRYYQIVKKTVDKHTGLDTKIIFIPKIIFPEIKTEDKNGPLFEEEKRNTTIGHPPQVRKEYTFQTMAVSSSNQLAYVSAQTVAKKIGSAYNPLFIYGPVGVGKTHLMHAIANKIFEDFPDKKIGCITSEGFTNEVVEAIRTNDTARMKKKFRNIDILIIDDIQFIGGKERVQEELFHTFNTLIDKGAQVVLSSDRPPSEIKKLEKRLSSRFSGGLTVDIESPDFELRTAILLIKAKKHDFPLTIEAAKKIAEKSQDARKLEGILLRIMTEAQAADGELSNSIIEKVLSNNQGAASTYYHPDEIIGNICSFYKIKPTQIKGAKRDAFLVKARQVAMYVLRSKLNLSYVEIGNILGGRDHTTIMHGVEKVEGLLSKQIFSDELNRVMNLTGGHVVD